MTHQINPDLLSDLARLLRRYGPDEFAHFAAALKDDAFCRELGETFSKLAAIRVPQKASVGKKQTSESSKHSQILAELQVNDPEKFGILDEFRRGVLARRLMPEASQLREFALQCGIKSPSRTTRERATNQLLRFLIGLSINELRTRLANIPQKRDSGEEYRRWVNFILRSDSTGKQ